MAWQQSDLDALDAAIAKNLRVVTFADGRQVHYQDADKMLQVRTAMKAELAASASQVSPRVRVTRARICRR
jgi:phage baseplate assembly protein gpV